MNQIEKKIYDRLKLISEQVKIQLQSKGIAIPVKHNDGTIKLGNFTIAKKQGFYVILDHTQETVVDKINLPQTAAILANKLALGRFLDKEILNADRSYGYAEFEEILYKRLAARFGTSDIDKTDVMLTKSKIKYYKKIACKQEILRSFEKLRKFA